jgi:hypothetical protein
MNRFEAEAIAKLQALGEAIMAAPAPKSVKDAAWTLAAESDSLKSAAQMTLSLAIAADAAADEAAHRVAMAKAEAEAIKDLAAKARAALLEAMEETGMPSVSTKHHTASTGGAARSVIVTDLAAIPAEYLKQPPPEPDKQRMRAALLDGDVIPGAVLSNSATVLRITSKKG